MRYNLFKLLPFEHTGIRRFEHVDLHRIVCLDDEL
jgi:hypothetical protein